MMWNLVFRRVETVLLLTACMAASAAAFEEPALVPDVWNVSGTVLESGPTGAFDRTSVKDPSIVYYNDKWHLFYTARGGDYTTGYVSAATLDGLATAPRYQLTQVHGLDNWYACAPQVFYFEPQERWYLITQTQDLGSAYQPVFSTSDNLENPRSWTEPQFLITNPGDWIDFWVICDNENAYLFYTQNHSNIMVRSTTLDNFPGDWGPAQVAFSGVHEAAHIYKAEGRDEYSMIYELTTGGDVRQYGLARASNLMGPWENVTDNWATGAQLQYESGEERWTDMVSHGEAIRTGYNQLLEYDADHPVMLIQGLLIDESHVDYPQLPWKLGLISTDTLAGDLNGDGFVGSADLDIVHSFWGEHVQPGSWLSGDPSGDGLVNSDDLDIVRMNWGVGLATVPEPHTFIGIVVLLLVGILRRGSPPEPVIQGYCYLESR